MGWKSARLKELAVPGGGALLSGVLQVLPFPMAGPVPVWRTHLCWVALVPLLWAVLGECADGMPVSRWQGAALGYVSGFVWYLGSCYWIYQTMHLYGGLSEPVAAGILVLFCLYLGLYHALFGAVLAHVRLSRVGRQGALLLVPVLWVAVELARTEITGFPWDLLGITQVDNPVLRQMAPWTGVCGMSFVIAVVNALWLVRLRVRDRRGMRTALAALGMVLVVGYGVLVLRAGRGVRMAGQPGHATLLQENLEVGDAAAGQPAEGEIALLRAFSALSRQPAATLLTGTPGMPKTLVVDRARRLVVRPGEASGEGMGALLAEVYEPSDLVVWPESPAPFEEGEPKFRAGMASLAEGMHAPLIVGNIGFDLARVQAAGGHMAGALYNSASVIAPDGRWLGRYDKIHLVPFGEYVPFRRLFFFAGSLLDQVGTFVPGQERRVFAVGGHTYGVFICYESIFGDEVREFAKMGAQVLVNISNDGWYGDTSAPWQHLNMLRMRAIETHRWVLRATNTGVTASIDPEGRVVASAPRHVRTAIRVPFAYETDVTFYAAHGDWFAWLCAVGAMMAVAFAEWSRRFRAPRARQPQ